MRAAGEMLTAALEYASRGVPVFPTWGTTNARCGCGRAECPGAGKHPVPRLAPHGVLDAKTDPAIICAWWTQYSTANIATPTSWCSVLDVDSRHRGYQTLATLERQHGPLPETPRVVTGGG